MRIAVLMLALLAPGVVAGQPSGRITFVVDKDKVRLSARLTPVNLTPEGKATASGNGVLFASSAGERGADPPSRRSW